MWSIALNPKSNADIHRIRTRWTLDDLLDAHIALSAMDEIKALTIEAITKDLGR